MRQQTIRNAIAWSYDLLDDAERELFAQLGIFPGDFAIESAELVCDTSLDVIASLVDKSLVQRTGRAARHAGDDPRVTRSKSSAQARSPTISATGTRHISRRSSPTPTRNARATKRRRWTASKPSTTTCARRSTGCAPTHPRASSQWSASLVGLWHLHSHFGEGRAYLADALAMTPDPDETRARVLSAIGELAAWSGDSPTARTSIEEAIPIWRESHRPAEIGASLLDLGWGWFNAGEDSRARDSMEESAAR